MPLPVSVSRSSFHQAMDAATSTFQTRERGASDASSSSDKVVSLRSQCPSCPECSGQEPNERDPRRHRPIRTFTRIVADVFIIFWAIINTIQNWPQEWAAIKETVLWAIIITLWVLHHLGIAMAITAH